MAIRKGERWLCQNPRCRSEILVTISSRMPGGLQAAVFLWRIHEKSLCPAGTKHL